MKIKAEQVKAYLQDHGNFFYDHPELVRELKVPTDSGVAVSLVEFQLRKLREQIQLLERENDHMIETARINSVLFEKTRALVLSLLNAGDLDDVSVGLVEKLANSVDIPIFRLLFSDQINNPDNIALISPIKAQEFKEGGNLAHAISDKEPWVGRLTADRRKQLFGKESQAVESCATLALIRGHTYGLLALGTRMRHTSNLAKTPIP